jgi:hypothetical protein
MASNEGHIHWSGDLSETINYLGQDLLIEMSEKRGGTTVRASSPPGPSLSLPNSSSASPSWDTVPGTAPALEVRVEPHYPAGYIRIRQA